MQMVLEVKSIGISKDLVKNVIIRTHRSRVEVINQKLNDIFEWKALKEIRDELKEIETFPHHVHKGEDIKPSEEPTLLEILKKIGEGI